MRVRSIASPPATVDADVLAVPVYREDAEMAADLAELDDASGGVIRAAIAWGEFNPLEHASALIDAGDLPAGRLLLLNAGGRGRGPWRARRLATVATRRLNGRAATTIALWLRDGEDDAAWSAAVAGAVSGTYRATEVYGRVRDTDAMRRSVEELVCVGAASQEALERGALVGEGYAFARDLSNRSANDLSPQRMAEVAGQLTSDGCTVEVLDPERLAELGMGLLLGVGQGATHPPRLIAIKLPGWDRAGDGARLAIVGKGVCFDTGGISIKPAAGMEDMKGDMAGAACVAGLMQALAARKAKVNVVGVVGLTENMPSGTATRPGDIVTSMSGQTIEVLNTDAEGRLVLADCLWYVQEKYKPKWVVNLATLTGAILVALGKEYAGLFSNDDALSTKLSKAGEATQEKVWRLPLGPKYDEMLKSKTADMKNIGGRLGGSITAAQFLQRFIKKGMPWAHLDIAGTGMAAPLTDINQSWGSGFGVRLLDRVIAENEEKK